MKPVIKKHRYYNLLLMRDDSAAHSFRISGGMLRFLILTFLLLVIGGAGGIAGGTYYWKKYRVLHREHKTQQEEYEQTRMQLGRLSNLQSVIAASNATVPQARNEEIGLALPQNRLHNATADVQAIPGQSAESAMHNATAQAYGQTNGTGIRADAIETATPAGQREHVQGDAPETENSTPLLSSPESPLRVSNLNARVSGPHRLRVNFELATTKADEQRIFSGTARYSAIFTDGSRAELTPMEADGARFAIQRMKPMIFSARVPQEHNLADIEAIQIVIELTNGSVYQDTFSIPR